MLRQVTAIGDLVGSLPSIPPAAVGCPLIGSLPLRVVGGGVPHRSRGCLPTRPHGHVVPPWSSSWPWVPPHSSPWVPLKPWVSFRSLSWPCSARPVVVVEWVPVARPCRCGNLPLVLETVGAPSLIVMAVWCPPLILMGVGASSLDLVVVAVAVVPHSPSWLLVPPSHCGSILV